MARRSFTVRDIAEILSHWHAGRSLRQISRSLGVARNTIKKYAEVAIEAGYQPGQEPLSAEEWSAFVCTHILTEADPQSVAFSQIAAFQEYIDQSLTPNHPTTVWQRLRDEHSLKASLSSFYRYLRHTWPSGYRRKTITILRHDPPPGHEAQIDFGYLGTWFDPVREKRVRLWVFAFVLAFSRHLFLMVVHRLDQQSWLECHIAAFAFLGGVPHRLVIDNLSLGVLKPDIYDPAINRAYQQLANHYGALVDPARVGHPKDKPRVERVIPYIRDSFWAGRTFLSLEEINAAALVWCKQVAGQRIHGTTRQRPLTVFETIEAPVLLPLPNNLFEIATWHQATIHPDCHAHVGGALYSVPWRFVGRQLYARLAATKVEFYLDHELVKTHLRVAKGQRQTDWNDYPPEKSAFMQRNPDWCRRNSATLGPEVFQAVNSLLETHALHFLRQSQGIIRLADKYGASRLNAACARANAFSDPSYRTIRNILEQGPSSPLPPVQPRLTCEA